MKEQSLHYSFQVAETARLDVALTFELEQFFSERSASRSKISAWIQDGLVSVDSRVIKKSGYKLKVGQLVEIEVPPISDDFKLLPDNSVSLQVVYQDESIIVIDKQAGLVVHPGAGVRTGTLANAIVTLVGPDVGHPLRPGIVHRLDKDTTGLMVVARTAKSYQHLIQQFVPPRAIKRSYLALTEKLPQADSVIESKIRRSAKNRTKMEVSDIDGKHSITSWELVNQVDCGYLLKLDLDTGRTHQIRVHLEWVKAPIIGEPTYNKGLSNKVKFPRQALHAASLSFIHPCTGERVSFESPLPKDISSLIEDNNS